MATKKILTNIDSDGTIESTGFIKTDGTSSQFLKADGSVDSNTYTGDQDLSGYYTETELDAGQLDNRYYTETESNSLYPRKYDFTPGNGAGGRRYIKLFTINDYDSSVVGKLSSAGDYGDSDRASYEIQIATRDNISFDVYQLSTDAVSDDYNFYYKLVSGSYEIWCEMGDYNQQNTFTKFSQYGTVSYDFNSATQTAPSGLTAVTKAKVFHEGHKPTFAEIETTPTTLAGYGITDAASSGVVNQTDFVSAANGGTFGGNVTIKHASSPTLFFTDDSPDPDNIGKIDVANNYMTYALDAADGTDSSRHRFQLDGTTVVEILPNTTYFRQTNLHLQNTAVSNINFRKNAAIVAGADIGKINFAATNDEGSSYPVGGNIIYEGDGTWDLSSISNAPTRMKIQLRNSSAALSTAMMLSSNLNANFYGDISATGDVTANGVTLTGDQTLPTDFVSAASGGTFGGTIKLNSELQFLRGSGEYSNYIRSSNYPSENYSSSTGKYWLEYGAKGGHHFVVNTDGGAGSSENDYDDFTIWNGAVDGDRLFEVTNAGNATFAGNISVDTDSTYDVGTSTVKFANIHADDFHGTFNGHLTGNAGSVSSIGNLTGHITSANRVTSLGSFTTAELNAAISDGDINSNSDYVSAANGGTFDNAVNIADVIDGEFTALRLMNQKTYGSGTGTNEKVRFVMGLSESGISLAGREGFAIDFGIQDQSDSSNGVVEFKVRDGGTLGTYQTVNGHNKSVEFVGSIHTAGNLGIGTAPTSRQLSVFRTTAGSIANFLHYTDATTFQGLYIQVSQATNDVIFQSSGSSGGGFKFYSGNAEKAGIDASGNATFSGSVTCGNLHASSFTDVITNSILTASADLDIKTVLTGRDIRFRSGSNAVQLRVKGDATGILINDHANLRGVATTSATATTIVATVAHALFSGIFFDFVIKNGTNVRAGTLTVCHDGTTVEYAETSTVDLGDTSDVTLSSNISGTLIRLIATSTSSTWTIKSLIRAI